jgi:SNF2 family DNA or RNA helicase
VTSYGVLRLDLEKLKATNWSNFILDESQSIKNPDALVSRAVYQIPALFKLALSGTPIENKLEELWSQFHFVLPGHLGSRDQFKDVYSAKIENGDAERAGLLKSRIKPFILRRLKRDVATELPEKIEVLRHCELEERENSFYKTLFAGTREKVLQALGQESGKVLEALELILRLRQACCHPALISPQEFAGFESSKVKLLMEEIEANEDREAKCLVFSQWTSFLDLIEESLKKRSIPFLRIDGSTSNRREIVDRFQNTGSEKVLLLSLKAAGVGLNLTAADRVFICDPWWNPSVEDQAADRAHRIGQKSSVVVSKLVAKDTIEERILELQAFKRELASQVLSNEPLKLGQTLTRDDILKLLSPMN